MSRLKNLFSFVRWTREKEEPLVFSLAEVCRIKMKVENVLELEKQIRAVAEDLPALHETDTVDLEYKFVIQYFGAVAKKLAAIKEICERPDVVVDVDCGLLELGECLIYKTLNELKKVIKIIKRRKYEALLDGLGQ